MKQQFDVEKQVKKDNLRDPAIVYSYENKFRFKLNINKDKNESVKDSKSFLLELLDFILDII